MKRLDDLDMAKGFGIFLVVLGHIEYIQESTLKWIFSFHMPLFFVVAGLLSRIKQESEKPLGELLCGKARTILVPYASFSLILLTMAALDLYFFPERLTLRELAREILDSVTGYGVHILWFLPVYFLANAGFALLNRYTKEAVRNLLVLLFAAAALVLVRAAGLTAYTDMEGSYVWYAGMNLFIVLLRSLLALPFILFGWYLGRFRESEKRMPDSFAGVLTGAFLMAAGLFLAIHSDIFDLHYLYVQPLHYLTAACSCAGLLLMMYSLPVSRILSYLGRNSLVIMCTHASFFVVYYISLGMFFIRKLIPIAQPVFNLGVAVLVCAAEIPLIWFFNRHCKYLLGRKV